MYQFKCLSVPQCAWATTHSPRQGTGKEVHTNLIIGREKRGRLGDWGQRQEKVGKSPFIQFPTPHHFKVPLQHSHRHMHTCIIWTLNLVGANKNFRGTKRQCIAKYPNEVVSSGTFWARRQLTMEMWLLFPLLFPLPLISSGHQCSSRAVLSSSVLCLLSRTSPEEQSLIWLSTTTRCKKALPGIELLLFGEIDEGNLSLARLWWEKTRSLSNFLFIRLMRVTAINWKRKRERERCMILLTRKIG